MRGVTSVLVVMVVLLAGVSIVPGLAAPVPAVFPVTVTVSTLAVSTTPYRFTFALFDAANGGTRLWSESKTYRLPLSRKITHQLGSVNPAGNPISPALFDRQLWVEASVGARKFARVRLGVVPYAVRSELAGTIEGRVAAGQVDGTGALAGDVLTVGGDGVASWQPPAVGTGDIQAVQTPPGGGLEGGTEAGVASLSLLRTCSSGDVLKWDGLAWACAPDTDTNPGGTVTAITAGAGLTGGTISTSGTIAVDTATIQARVGATCAPGSSIRAIGADGAVTCEVDDADTGGAGTGWALNGNAGTTGGTNYLGTSDNQPLEVRVNGTRALRVEPTAGTPNLLGGHGDNAVTAPAGGAAIGGGGQAGEANTVTDDFGTVGGGADNRAGDGSGSAADAPYATVGGGQGNAAQAQWATVGGGRWNNASASHTTVAGGWGNGASGNFASVGGGQGNSADGAGATVAGGQQNTSGGVQATVGGGYQNRATQMYGVVAGGTQNQATGQAATIGGGSANQAAGPGGTIGGGVLNEASANAAVVAGGQLNEAKGEYAAVAGGTHNVAGGLGAAVPGGRHNQAGGETSLAAGYMAVVRGAADSGDGNGDEGTFVWADAQGVPFVSTAPNQFLVRAQGGVGVNRNDPSSALDVNGTVTATGLRLTTAPAAGYVLTADAGGNGSWQPPAAGGGGTVTQVASGAGLTGGPITGTGTISVATGGIVEAMIADGAVTDAKIAGPIGTTKLNVGTAAGTVAAGDHAHAGMGDITAVNTADGSGLTGGAGSGAVSLAVDTTTIQARVGGACAPGSSIQAIAADGTVTCEADDSGEGSTWSLAGNSGTNPGTTFVGTTDDVPLELRVNNQRALRLERATTTVEANTFAGVNVVGGDAGNGVTAGVTAATISGGGGTFNGAAAANEVTDLGGTVSGGWQNRAGDGQGTLDDRAFATVGGGGGNLATGRYATIAGGASNWATDDYAAVGGGGLNQAAGYSATVGGGWSNRASGYAATAAGGRSNVASGGYAALVGGDGNTASGMYAGIAGGYGNTASGAMSMVAGGAQNEAGGRFSLAAGRRAKVRNPAQSGAADGDEGTFVWADSADADFQSTGDNQFLIRAAGGVGINRNSPRSALDVAGTISANSTSGNGVQGTSYVEGASGVYGESIGAGYGVAGRAWGFDTAIFGDNPGGDGLAGLFNGRVYVGGDLDVAGTLTKGAGSFRIDHPLDPRNRYLSHSFVESPDMMNIYNGVVMTDERGYATVGLPAWFGALNRDFRYQLTVIGSGETWARARVFEEMKEDRFVIQTDVPGTKVSWQVTGIRQDPYANAHRIPVEEDKPVAERGTCLHAEACGEQLAQGQ